jgi:F1F0 ATPase subunit 2
MNELPSLAYAVAAGILLGAIFFGGLWWTVHRCASSNRVALWFLGSALLRTCIVLLGFHFVLGDDWKRLLAGLAGFIIARLIATRLARAAEEASPSAPEAGNAP